MNVARTNKINAATIRIKMSTKPNEQPESCQNCEHLQHEVQRLRAELSQGWRTVANRTLHQYQNNREVASRIAMKMAKDLGVVES